MTPDRIRASGESRMPASWDCKVGADAEHRRTSIVATPAIVGVLYVTYTMSTTGDFLFIPVYANLVTGTSGNTVSILVDLRKLAELTLGQVGAGLDPGPLAARAGVIAATK